MVKKVTAVAIILIVLLSLSFVQADTGRLELTIPDELVEMVKENVGFAGQKLGISFDDLQYFTGSQYIPNRMITLFSDVTAFPRLTGRLAERFVSGWDDIKWILVNGFARFDSYGGLGFGCVVDVEGNDDYRGSDDAYYSNTFGKPISFAQRCARDVSVGIFIDGDGDWFSNEDE